MKKIAKTFLGSLTVVCMLGLFFVPFASALTFDLNYTISATPTPVTPNWGTLTITDDGNSVDLLVSPTNTSWKLLELDLNYVGGATSFSYTGTGGNGTVNYSPDGIKADGYSAGMFDLAIPATGNFGNVSGDVLIVLSAGSVNLDPSNFDFKDSNGLLTSAEHFGNLPQAQGGSIWVGSGPGTTNKVPEPSTMLLLGSGLLGLALFGRKKFGK